MGLVTASFTIGSHGERYFCELFATDAYSASYDPDTGELNQYSFYPGMHFSEHYWRQTNMGTVDNKTTFIGEYVKNPYNEERVVMNISYFLRKCENSSSMYEVLTLDDANLEDIEDDQFGIEISNITKTKTIKPLEITIQNEISKLKKLTKNPKIKNSIKQALIGFTAKTKTFDDYTSAIIKNINSIPFENYKSTVERYFSLKNEETRKGSLSLEDSFSEAFDILEDLEHTGGVHDNASDRVGYRIQ